MRKSSEHLPRIVELLKPILENLFFLVLFQEGIAFAQSVILIKHSAEQLPFHSREDMQFLDCESYLRKQCSCDLRA